jgi:Meiotically up-regulated gene 113
VIDSREIIDVSEYTRKGREYLRTIGACCLYVVCPDLEKPSRIGSTNDIVSTLETLQRGCWFRLKVAFILWTPSKIIARRIEEVCHGSFVTFRLDGEWFDVQATGCAESIEREAKSIYPTVSYMDHSRMVAFLKRWVAERAA